MDGFITQQFKVAVERMSDVMVNFGCCATKLGKFVPVVYSYKRWNAFRTIRLTKF